MITEPPEIYFNSISCSHSANIAGVSGEIYGYYNREYVEVPTAGAQIDGYKPVFTCAASVAPARGAVVEISGVTESFTVLYVQKFDDIEAKIILAES